MKNYKLIFYILITISSLYSNADVIHPPENLRAYQYVRGLFSDTTFNQIQDITRLVLNQCSPPECIVVGIGRSPTPIISSLEILNPNSTLEIPLTNFRYSPNADKMNDTRVGKLTPQEEEGLFQYFDDFLKRRISTKTKTIMLIDYTISGSSFFSAQLYLDKYIKNRDLKLEMKTTAITVRYKVGIIEKIAKHFSVKKPTIITIPDRTPLFSAFENQYFDDIATYDQFPIMDKKELFGTLPTVNESAKRQEYLDYYKKKMLHPNELKIEECVKKGSLLYLGHYFD